MKLLILAIFAIAAASAVENFDGPEWQPIDWANVVPATEYPGFWDNTVFAQLFPKTSRNRRIVGGQEATRNAHPYQVAQIHQRAILQTMCGGSVISPTVILTAAHCPINSVSTTVITGAHNMNQIEPTQQRRTVQAANYRLHANYNSQNLNNDIATMILPTPLTWTASVQPIALAQANAGSFENVIGQSTGWGRVADGAGSSPVLRVVTNRIISNAECAAVFGAAVVNHAVICIDTTGGRGTCQGDSGGVLSVPNGATRLQVGITSFGSSAGCEMSFPAGFERVSAQINWINNNMS
ncbi:brachyurin-like [Chironomus tepperi]|uniref:brachyurin-like n=1 Tax=Chironomus tepperi TaxID=113505 RepID=UPI00391F0683